jgi:hypothetical protein
MENNDSIPAALPLQIGKAAHGLIGFDQHMQGQYKRDSCDFYKLTMPLDGTNSLKITLKTTAKAGYTGTVGYRLWSKTGQMLANKSYFSYTGGTIDSTIYRSYLLDTCYVEVFSEREPHEYTLICTEKPQSHSDMENNDSIPAALSLNEGEIAHGLIGFDQHTQGQYKKDMSDFYKCVFSSNEDESKTAIPKITIKATSKSIYTGIIGYRLWSKTGQNLAEKSISIYGGGSITDSTIYSDNNTVNIDTCYIEVYNGSTNGSEYELRYGKEIYSAAFETVLYNNRVSIVNKSAGLTFDWNFGDGTPVSHAKVPEHTYARPGTYEIVQTAHFTVQGRDLSVFARDTVVVHGIDSYSPKVIGNSDASSIVIYGGGLDETLDVWLT